MTICEPATVHEDDAVWFQSQSNTDDIRAGLCLRNRHGFAMPCL